MTTTSFQVLLAIAALVQTAGAATAVFTVVDDTTLVQDGGADDNNFGGRNELIASQTTSGSNRRFSLLRFDVSSLAGQFASIDSVTLQLRLNTGAGRSVPTTGQILDVHRISEANAGWVEGTGTAGDAVANNVPNPNTATWRALSDNSDSLQRVNWAGSAGLNTATTDYFPTAMGSTLAFNGANGYAQGVVIQIPLTASGFTLAEMVNDWAADGAASAGLVIRGRLTTANNQIFFDSNETILVGAQPASLTINYTPIPEPSAAAALLALASLGTVRRKR